MRFPDHALQQYLSMARRQECSHSRPSPYPGYLVPVCIVVALSHRRGRQAQSGDWCVDMWDARLFKRRAGMLRRTTMAFAWLHGGPQAKQSLWNQQTTSWIALCECLRMPRRG